MRFSTYYRIEKANLCVSRPPRVSKTLTAKGLAKHLKRLLYIVCLINNVVIYANVAGIS
jgi:hypothetical protein